MPSSLKAQDDQAVWHPLLLRCLAFGALLVRLMSIPCPCHHPPSDRCLMRALIFCPYPSAHFSPAAWASCGTWGNKHIPNLGSSVHAVPSAWNALPCRCPVASFLTSFSGLLKCSFFSEAFPDGSNETRSPLPCFMCLHRPLHTSPTVDCVFHLLTCLSCLTVGSGRAGILSTLFP